MAIRLSMLSLDVFTQTKIWKYVYDDVINHINCIFTDWRYMRYGEGYPMAKDFKFHMKYIAPLQYNKHHKCIKLKMRLHKYLLQDAYDELKMADGFTVRQHKDRELRRKNKQELERIKQNLNKIKQSLNKTNNVIMELKTRFNF